MMSCRSSVALEDLLHGRGDLVVLVADRVAREDARGAVERVHGRVDALLGDGARKHRRGVEVGEGRRRRGVGKVVGRHVDRLHGRDRPALGARDALLQLAHLVGQRGLVADRARHAAEQGRDLGAGLDEAEDVVDEQQHVLAALLAEVLGDREPGEAHTQTRAGRLVHLAVDQRRLVDHARLLHLQPQVVALARPLAHAAEHREAAVLRGDVVDELHDDDGLAHAGAAEEADLAALDVGSQQVDHLDARLEELVARVERLEARCRPVDGPALGRLDLAHVVDGLPHHVHEPAERHVAHGDRHLLAGVGHLDAARESVGRVHGDGSDLVVAEMLLHLGDQLDGLAVAPVDRDVQRVVDSRHLIGEANVDHRPDHLYHCAFVHPVSSVLTRLRTVLPAAPRGR